MDEPTQNKFIGKIKKAISEIKTYLKNISASEKNLVKDISNVTMQLDCLQNIADLWAKGVANSMNEFERLTKSENADSTANETVAYSKKVKYNNSDFSKALDAREWKKFNNLMTTGKDTGLRISPTSLLVECENDSPYIYKYVRYNELSDDIVIEDVYAIGKIDTNYEDNVQFQARTIANVINELEEIGYDNRQYVRKILASYIKNTSYVLAGYSNKTSRYNVIGRGSRENGTNTFQKSDRAGSLGSSQENGDKFSLKTSSVDSEGNKLTEAQQEFYKNSVIRDAEGRIKPFYHGTARADRVGNYFNPERATSGPMAYFTDNQKIAENYSRDKTDTSLAYDSEYDSYETQFRVNVGGKSVSIVDYWKTLPIAEKNKITQKAEQLTIDDDYENLILKRGNKYGNGGFDLRYARASEGSNAHEEAIKWANNLKVNVGDWRLATYNDKWYIIEKFDTVDLKYQVTEKVSAKQYKFFREEWLKQYGNQETMARVYNEIDSFDRQTTKNERGRPNLDDDVFEYSKKDISIQRMVRSENREQSNQLDTGSGSVSGNENRQGNGTFGLDKKSNSEKFSIKSIPNNRVLLSNALETVTQNDIERKYIRDYKAQISMLEEQQEKLKKINEEIGVLSFAPRQEGHCKA